MSFETKRTFLKNYFSTLADNFLKKLFTSSNQYTSDCLQYYEDFIQIDVFNLTHTTEIYTEKILGSLGNCRYR